MSPYPSIWTERRSRLRPRHSKITPMKLISVCAILGDILETILLHVPRRLDQQSRGSLSTLRALDPHMQRPCMPTTHARAIGWRSSSCRSITSRPFGRRTQPSSTYGHAELPELHSQAKQSAA